MTSEALSAPQALSGERDLTVFGVRGILVHAISDHAKRFYAKWGLALSPADPLTLMVRLADIVATIGAIG